jgi:hypothetical protein
LHTVSICSEHTDEDADTIIEAFKKSLTQMKEDGFLQIRNPVTRGFYFLSGARRD